METDMLGWRGEVLFFQLFLFPAGGMWGCIHINFIVLRQISAHRSDPGKERDPNLPWVHNDTHLRCLWPYMFSIAILWDGYYFLFSDRKLKFQRLVTAWYHLLGSGKGRIWVQIDEATMPMLLPLYPMARIYQKLHPFPLKRQSWIGQDVNSSACCAFSLGGFILASCSGLQGLCEFCGNHVLFDLILYWLPCLLYWHLWPLPLPNCNEVYIFLNITRVKCKI